MAKKNVTWIVVADSVQARVYGNDGPGRGIYRTLERDFTLDLPHKVGGIMSDREGRSAGFGGRDRHAVSPRTGPRRHLEEEFMRRVAGELDRAAEAKYYDRLVLVAPPRALGMLRAGLGSHASALVSRELHKDFVHLPEPELEGHLIEAEAIA